MGALEPTVGEGAELWEPRFDPETYSRKKRAWGLKPAESPPTLQISRRVASGFPSQLCSGELERTLAAACDSARGARTATGGGVLRGSQGDDPV